MKAIRLRLHPWLFCLLAFLYYPTETSAEEYREFSHYKEDPSLGIIIVNVPELHLTASPAFSLSGREFRFTEEVPSEEIPAASAGYSVTEVNTGASYTLYFSQLPLIDIRTVNGDTIANDTDYILADFQYTDSRNNAFARHKLVLRQRGSSSLAFPKVSYRLEFREEADTSRTKDVQFPGMERTDDDWNLQALYNERLRLRSKVAFELWQQIHQPYYLRKEANAQSGIAMQHADVFINGKYLGIYCLAERIDRKQLKLKKHDGQIRGELYKGIAWGNTTFTQLLPYTNGKDIWGGFEYQYPDEIAPDWRNLYNFIYFAMRTNLSSFLLGYEERLHTDNFIDYFIFMNLLRMTDNQGKNIYVAKYDQGEPYFYVPWDLDLSFGYAWSEQSALLSARESGDDILRNGLYDRLLRDDTPDGFVTKFRQRWQELRTNVITTESILSLFQTYYNDLWNNGAYHRENKTWPESFLLANTSDELAYLSAWLTDRIAFLDSYADYSSSIEDIPVAEVTPSITYHAADNSLHISSVNQSATLRIYNLNGQCVQESLIDHENTSVAIPGQWPAGVYIARLSNERLSLGVKFVPSLR